MALNTKANIFSIVFALLITPLIVQAQEVPLDRAVDQDSDNVAAKKKSKYDESGQGAMTKTGVQILPSDVLYYNLELGLKMHVAEYDITRCKPRVSGAALITKDGKYFIKADSMTEATIELIYWNVDSVAKVLSTQKFKVERLPDPVVYFGKYKGGNAPAKELQKGTKLFPVFSMLAFEPESKLLSFSLTLIPKGGSPQIFNFETNELSEEVRKIIRKLPEGSTLFFDDIRIQCEGESKERMVRGMVITVKSDEK